MIVIAIIITTILEHIKAYIQEIPEITRKTTQALKSMTTKISRSKLIQNIRESYKTAVLAITIATRMTDHTSHINQLQTANRNKQKLQAHKNLATNMMGHTSCADPGLTMIVTTSTTSYKLVSDVLHKDRTKHGNTQTQNSK